MLGAPGGYEPYLSNNNNSEDICYNRKQRRNISKQLGSVPTELLFDELLSRPNIQFFELKQCDELGISEPCKILVRKE